MIANEFQDLPTVLRRLQEADTELRVFGANIHKYQLRPPLAENEVQAFELKYHVKLPDDFRWFYTHVGNGGAGPYYGLAPLNDTIEVCDVTKPFSWIENVNVDLADEAAELYPGILQICHQGCAGFSYLVINGPAYGMVWTGAEGEFWPDNMTFADWYRRWMDMLTETALPLLANERVVKQIRVGMTKDEVISICGGEWEEQIIQRPFMIFLAFKHLRTKFELDGDRIVTRIVDLHI